MYFIFGLYILQPNTRTYFTYKRQSIGPHSLDWLKESRQNVSQAYLFHTCGEVKGEQAALRKLTYSEAVDQTRAEMDDWVASKAYHSPQT